MITQFIYVLLYVILFLIGTKLKKCVTELFLKIIFDIFVYYPEKYKTQRMCDEAIDDCLAALKFIPDWFVTCKMIKNFLLLYTQMIMYSILMKILVMP